MKFKIVFYLSVIVFFSTCRPEIAIPVHEMIVSDTVDLLGVHYISDANVVYGSGWGPEASKIDLNEDGILDIEFYLDSRDYTSGGSTRDCEFKIINENCSVLGREKQTFLAKWKTFDSAHNRFCYRTILYNESDSTLYDSLLTLTPENVVEVDLLDIGDTIRMENDFLYLNDFRYVLYTSEYSYIDYLENCRITNFSYGDWGEYDNGLGHGFGDGFMGFKIEEDEKTSLGWIHFKEGRIPWFRRIAYIDL